MREAEFTRPCHSARSRLPRPCAAARLAALARALAFAAALLAPLGPATAAPPSDVPADLLAGLPETAEQTSASSAPGVVLLPMAPAQDGVVPRSELHGLVQVETWRVPDVPDSLHLTRPLRGALEAAGWRVLLDCAAELCGGFDFRFALTVAPEPQMHLELGAFRYLLANRGEDWVALLASHRAGTGWLQRTRVGPLPEPDPPAADTAETGTETPAVALDGEGAGTLPPASEMAADLVAQLVEQGHAVLEDLTFASNEAEITAPSRMLEALAGFLAADPRRRLLLVGHTDATGALAANITVSQRRARAVLELLVRKHGVPRRQLEAEGVGFLAPRASNTSPEGRSRNRRVEAVLLPAD